MDTNRIALQLYTLREQARQDLPGTLRRLAEAGYRAVELAGYYNHTPTELRKLLADYGLTSISAHISLKEFESNPAQVLQGLQTLGCTYAVVPSVPEERRQTREQFEQLADTLNRLAEVSHEAGLKFAYHNHAFEFNPVENTSLWEVLVAKTDPRLVSLELDLYWASFAGFDPLEIIQSYPGRFPLLHVKDMAATEKREDLAVGEGILPWSSLLPAARAAGAEWYIVEMDHPREAFREITSGFEYLKNLTF
jgi:sugar phosphate isomerase/epimerase